MAVLLSKNTRSFTAVGFASEADADAKNGSRRRGLSPQYHHGRVWQGGYCVVLDE
jgi:hypothetical protein